MPTFSNKKVSILWMLFATATVLTALPLIISVIMTLRTGVSGQYWNLFVQVASQLFQPFLFGLIAWELHRGREGGIYRFGLFLAGWNTIVPLLSVSTILVANGFSYIMTSIQSLGWVGYVYVAIIVLNWIVTAVAATLLLLPDVKAYFKYDH